MLTNKLVLFIYFKIFFFYSSTTNDEIIGDNFNCIIFTKKKLNFNIF